jgi:lysophospholipase L1-like esterase
MKQHFLRVFGAIGALGLASILPACGGSGVGPSATPTPQSTPQPTNPATFVAYLDENANGTFEPSEGTRIPGVEVVVGTAKGTTAARSGALTLQIPDGAQTVTVTASSLPPFYRPPAAGISLTAPATAQVMIPITLPRGSNRANVYMAFGDSITKGEPNVGDGTGYRRTLANLLESHFGAGEVANEGRDATDTNDGADIIGTRLAAIRPTFVLIHYGTNDWNNCKQVPCFTTTNLRFMVQQINRVGAHAFLASILPTNTGYDDRAPASRNIWVGENNVLIKQIADQEGAVFVDLNAAFLTSGRALPALFVDHVHPTAPGYEIMAQTWFSAITKAYSKILSDF